MKRIILSLIVLLFCLSVKAQETFTSGGITYQETSTSKLTVSVGRGSYSGIVTIPETVSYNDRVYTVTSIGNSAFSSCSGLTSITIPSSVTSIGYYAFRSCTGLTSITIPSSVTSIGNSAFSGCSNLMNIVVVDDNPEYSSLDGIVFNKDKTKIILCLDNKKGSVTIPSSVTSIGDYAFSGCSGLTSIDIPSGVTLIERSAFSGCRGLTSVTIPSGVTLIRDYAFSSCSGLTSVTIPSSVTLIGFSAFSGCRGLTSVTIPSAVRSIEDYAFQDCSGLTSVTIPSSVLSIGDFAFSGCSGLKSANIEDGDNVLLIRSFSFENNSFESIYLGRNISNIDIGEVIKGKLSSEKLTSITIGPKVSSIGNALFSGCSALTSVTIPNSVTVIESSAFSNCTNLRVVNIEDGDEKLDLARSAFSGTPVKELYLGRSLDAYLNSNTSMGDLKIATIGDKVISFGNIFYGCNNLISITMGSNVSSIAGYAFYGCDKLKSVVIPNSVVSIGGSAFEDCIELASVIVPESVESVGDFAFFGCYGLTDISVYNPIPVSITDNVFSATTYNKAKLHVPQNSISTYGKATGWKNFFNVSDDLTSDIASYGSADMRIYAKSGNIVIENARQGIPVRVYNESGVLVKSLQTVDNRIEVQLPADHVYIIKCDGKTEKVRL